jgi:PAS domain S-box-containing protein/diguanylate cyclase (GGDEF)-like protein
MSGELGPNIYKAILENLPNGVYAVDRDRKILFWNAGAERITGYLSQEVIGRHCQDDLLMHCDASDAVLCGNGCPLLATIHDGQPREALVYLRHKEGQRVPVRVRAAPIHNADGMIVGAAESFDEAPAGESHVHPDMPALPSRVDELSGVPDQESTAAFLEVYLRDFARDNVPFCVMAIAIDRFAHFREDRGARATEKIFHTVASTLSRTLRTADKLGRWRTEWFLAIVDACPSPVLPQVAGLLRRVVSLAAIPWWGDRLSVTISAGGTEARMGDTPQTLLARAEQALAASIQKGGDSFEIV